MNTEQKTYGRIGQEVWHSQAGLVSYERLHELCAEAVISAYKTTQRVEEMNDWLHLFASPSDGESIFDALKREHQDKWDVAYGWRESGCRQEEAIK